jgi:predicted ATP-grasp superfamily ATP-dependent carboligase
MAAIASDPSLLIVGASARAAAFSALRAGLRPECADLFGDADLEGRCTVHRVGSRDYPRAFRDLSCFRQPGPWLYTGGLENHPELIDELARLRRPLWGNPAAVLRRVRSPFAVRDVLRNAGLPCPAVRPGDAGPAAEANWLLKPLAGAGGVGIRLWRGGHCAPSQGRPFYWQEFIDGEPCSAVYFGNGQAARLLGLTKQLVGEPWLHAAAFHYCGSVGPLPTEPRLWQAFAGLGAALGAAFGLKGLFGIDCVLCGSAPYPVEVNPRYTASVEVIEYATGLHALALHREAFEASGGRQPPVHEQVADAPRSPVVGKAILFARERLQFPADGPWRCCVTSSTDVSAMPSFADIPHAGELIEAGHPVMTFFARASTIEECHEQLRRRTADLDRRLFGR